MKLINKVMLTILILILLFQSLNITYIKSNAKNQNAPIKVGVLLCRFDDYITKVCNRLEQIEIENQQTIDFIFYDSKESQDLQNEQLNKLIKDKVNLILLNVAEIDAAQSVVNRIKETNTPVILFNREPTSPEVLKSYGKCLYIGTDGREAGAFQGDIIISIWENHKNLIDKNNDNILQYVILKGEKDHLEAQQRTLYSLKTITDAGIETVELGSEFCNWQFNCAKTFINSLFLRYGDSIEAIISNNDAMAEGSIAALQESGYNKGNEQRTIVVIGVDAIDTAITLINDGYMAGTVIQNAEGMANALYEIGLNMVSGKNPLENTKYKFDNTGVSVRIPYEGTIMNNDFYFK